MQKLGNREEQIMQALWHLGKAFVKEIIVELPDPKPHYNSVATMVRILEEKGLVGHESIGNSFRYYPLLSKNDYQKHTIGNIVMQYFDNSYSNMLAYFAKEEKISKKELDAIMTIIKNKKS